MQWSMDKLEAHSNKTGYDQFKGLCMIILKSCQIFIRESGDMYM